MSVLAGKRVVITRPAHQADWLVERLLAAGAVPIAFPTIEIIPCQDTARLDQALTDLATYDWLVFTSQNGVDFFWRRFVQANLNLLSLAGLKVAAIGPATARALAEREVKVHYVPAEYVAEAVARGFPDPDGKRILLPRATVARDALVRGLTQRGAVVDEIPVYETVTPRLEPQVWQELDFRVDVVTFTSSSTVRGFFDLLGERSKAVLQEAASACIGPITAGTLQEFGFQPQIIATEYTADGLLNDLIAYFETSDRKETE